jgi:hypothetical protein
MPGSMKRRISKRNNERAAPNLYWAMGFLVGCPTTLIGEWFLLQKEVSTISIAILVSGHCGARQIAQKFQYA